MVIVPLPDATSNTVPSPDAPPPAVVPKRLPLLSSTSPATGAPPSVPLNEARVVIVLLPAAISNTVPWPNAPPSAVVPKRLPLLSSTKPPERGVTGRAEGGCERRLGGIGPEEETVVSPRLSVATARNAYVPSASGVVNV